MNATTFDPSSSNQSYLWQFTGGSPSPSSSSAVNPEVQFVNPNQSITATLTATDNAGACNLAQNLATGVALPKYKEVLPRPGF